MMELRASERPENKQAKTLGCVISVAIIEKRETLAVNRLLQKPLPDFGRAYRCTGGRTHP